MDFGALPPEINSARIYAGPGSGSMLAAAAAWEGLAAELHSGAAAYTSVISGLTTGPWLGPSSTAMAGAAAPYVAWMSATAGQAELAATQAQAAAGAYGAAFAMTVPPPVIAANRAQLMMLVATNFFGQNTPAISATEAQYGEMWAQDAAAMYGYAANSAAITAKVTPITAAPQTTNPAGLAAQSATVTQAAGTSIGTGVQSTLSQLVSTVPTALQSLASPSSSTSSAITSATPFGEIFSSSGLSIPGIAQGLIANYAYLPGFFSMFIASDALAPLMGTPIANALTAAAAPVADVAGAAEGAWEGAEAAGGGLGAGFAGGFGGLAGLGEAGSVGALSVPPSWGWAATGPAAMLGGMPLAAPLPGVNPGAIGGVPLAAGVPLMGGLQQSATTGAGGAAAKYGSRLAVVARPPAAGYPPVPVAPPTPAHPLPAGLPPPTPGYTPTIVYMPTNGHGPTAG